MNKVLAEIDRHQVSLNSTSHNAMLSALVHCGRANEVFQEYLNMTDPTIETFGVLLLACAKGHNLDKVSEIWSAIYDSGLIPQLYCYNSLLLCLRDCTLPDHMTKQSSHVTVIPSNRKCVVIPRRDEAFCNNFIYFIQRHSMVNITRYY